MPEKSGVSWTDSSHGFWYGCQKVSQGCKACYAERQMARYWRPCAVTRDKSWVVAWTRKLGSPFALLVDNGAIRPAQKYLEPPSMPAWAAGEQQAESAS